MIMLEADKIFQRLPGMFKEYLNGKLFFRVWFLWFAVTYTRYDLKGLHDYIASGNTTWTE